MNDSNNGLMLLMLLALVAIVGMFVFFVSNDKTTSTIQVNPPKISIPTPAKPSAQ